MPPSRLPPVASCLLFALGCNAFDDPAPGDDVDFGFGFGPPPTVTPPSRFPPPQQIPSMAGSAPAIGIGGVTMVPCMTCGAFCSDCGMGCMCEEGHSPFEAPSWNVPLTPAGEQGWRESSAGLCAGFESVLGVSLWGDGSSVYAMVAGGRVSPGADEVLGEDDAGVERVSSGILSGSRTRVLHNEGGGWALRADLPGTLEQGGLVGLSPSSLILYGGPGPDGRACMLGVLSSDGFACQDVDGDGPVRSVAVVNERLAFALVSLSELRVYDGTSWSAHAPAPEPATAVWASASDLVLVGPSGIVQRFVSGEWTSERVGEPELLTAVWGTSANDLWVGSFSGALFHFDGDAWQQVAKLGGQTCMAEQPVTRIWGAGSHVWVATEKQLARWDGSELETFGNWSCAVGESDSITDVWGTAEDDVFVAVSSGLLQPPCGSAFVLHYDGESFHRF